MGYSTAKFNKEHLAMIKNDMKGKRVEVHPATSAFMQGDRYGEVIAIGTKYISVRMDKSGKVKKFSRDLLTVI